MAEHVPPVGSPDPEHSTSPLSFAKIGALIRHKQAAEIQKTGTSFRDEFAT